MRNEMNKMRRKIGMKAEMHALRIMVKTMLIWSDKIELIPEEKEMIVYGLGKSMNNLKKIGKQIDE